MNQWIRNRRAPSSLWEGLVFDGAFAGLHPGTTRFIDGSGLENHGTLTNMDPPTDWIWVPELGRWGLDMDGLNDCVLQSSPVKTFPVTLIALVKLKNVTATHRILSLDIPGSATQFASLVAQGNAAGDPWLVQTEAAPLSTGTFVADQWYCAAGEFASVSSRALWLNGVKINSASSGSAAGDWTNLSIGRLSYNVPTHYTSGQISDVLVYSRVLAIDEHQFIANPANRLYVPDTRRVVAFSASSPWLYARRPSRFIGSGLGV